MRALPVFGELNSQILIELREANAAQAGALISNREVDLMLCREPAVWPEGWEFSQLIPDRLDVVAGPAHPLVGRGSPHFAGLLETGTQSNLCAILAHCGRGDEYIVGQAHCYRWEGGGAAALGGVQPQPIEYDADGTLSLDRTKAANQPDNEHFARTRLLALENTLAGKLMSDAGNAL